MALYKFIFIIIIIVKSTDKAEFLRIIANPICGDARKRNVIIGKEYIVNTIRCEPINWHRDESGKWWNVGWT